MGGTQGWVPVLITTPRDGLELALGDRDPLRARQATPPPHETAALGLEALNGHVVVPVVGRLRADPLGDRRPVGRHT